MVELKAPTGAFLLLELEPLTPREVTEIFARLARQWGVRSVCDLATIPIELLHERVLLRLSPEEQQVWARATQKKK